MRMTLREILEWAKKNDCLDCVVCVQYRDGGGLYYGEDYDLDPRLEERDSKKVIICRKKENTNER